MSVDDNFRFRKMLRQSYADRFRYFSTIAYSADGLSLLAAGRSKNVCIYNVKDGILLKKFEVTQNRSLDALDVCTIAYAKWLRWSFWLLYNLQDFINRRNVTEFGNMALVEKREALEGGNVAIRLPGVQKGDMASRNYKPEIRVFSVRFSPTAQSWAAATTEGLLIYALDKGMGRMIKRKARKKTKFFFFDQQVSFSIHSIYHWK